MHQVITYYLVCFFKMYHIALWSFFQLGNPPPMLLWERGWSLRSNRILQLLEYVDLCYCTVNTLRPMLMIVWRYFHKGTGNNSNIWQGLPGIWSAHTEFVGLQVVARKSWVMHQVITYYILCFFKITQLNVPYCSVVIFSSWEILHPCCCGSEAGHWQQRPWSPFLHCAAQGPQDPSSSSRYSHFISAKYWIATKCLPNCYHFGRPQYWSNIGL